MEQNKKPTEVSSELNIMLEEFSGSISNEKQKAAKKIEHEFMKDPKNRDTYTMSMWKGGCYYVCSDSGENKVRWEDGTW